jgi:hypothetical protein
VFDANGDATTLYTPMTAATTGTSNHKRSLLSWLKKEWHGVLSIGQRIWSTIKDIYNIGVMLLSSGISYQNSWTTNLLAINLNTTTGQALAPISFENGSIVCSNCWGRVDLTLQFSISVAQLKLQNFRINAIGAANFSVESTFRYNFQFSKTSSFIWARIKSKPILFSIGNDFIFCCFCWNGILVARRHSVCAATRCADRSTFSRAKVRSIGCSCGFCCFFVWLSKVGYSVDVRVASRLLARAFAHGALSYGVEYAAGDLRPLSSHLWESHGSLDQLAAGEDSDVSVYLMREFADYPVRFFF